MYKQCRKKGNKDLSLENLQNNYRNIQTLQKSPQNRNLGREKSLPLYGGVGKSESVSRNPKNFKNTVGWCFLCKYV